MPDAPNHPQAAWAWGWIRGGDDAAMTAGLQHMRWARRDGQSPMGVLLALHDKAPRTIPLNPSWDDLVWALAAAYQDLPAPGRFAAVVEESAGRQLVLPLRAGGVGGTL